MKKLSLGFYDLVKKTLIIAVSVILAVSVTVNAIADGEKPSKIAINSFDSPNLLGWRDTSLAVTENSENAVEGGKCLSFDMTTKNTYKGFSFALPQVGILNEKAALCFYLKAPKEDAEKSNFWFQIFYEYANAQITHNGDFDMYIQKKGTVGWEKTTYWNGYGPNIPYGFEGYVKIPLTGPLRVSYSSTGETTVKMDKVTNAMLFLSNFGGEAGAVYIDDMYVLTEDDTDSSAGGGDIKGDLQILYDFESNAVGDSLKNDKNNPTGKVTFTGISHDFEAVVSNDASGDGSNSLKVNSIIEQNFAQMLLSLSKPMLKNTKSVIIYVKGPKWAKEEEFNFTFAALVTGGDYKLPDCKVKVLRRGETEWQDEEYFADWGVNLNGGFEGYLQFNLDDFIVAWNQPGFSIPKKVAPEDIYSFGFWINHFGGGNSETAFYFDSLYGNCGEFDNDDFRSLVKKEFYESDNLQDDDNNTGSDSDIIPKPEEDEFAIGESFWDYAAYGSVGSDYEDYFGDSLNTNEPDNDYNTDIPHTGDSSNMDLAFLVLVVSGIMLVSLFSVKRIIKQ